MKRSKFEGGGVAGSLTLLATAHSLGRWAYIGMQGIKLYCRNGRVNSIDWSLRHSASKALAGR